jgi:hypothetical protein
LLSLHTCRKNVLRIGCRKFASTGKNGESIIAEFAK